jgi:hypothetical protein
MRRPAGDTARAVVGSCAYIIAQHISELLSTAPLMKEIMAKGGGRNRAWR